MDSIEKGIWLRIVAPAATVGAVGAMAGSIDGQWLEDQFEILPDELSFFLSVGLGVVGAVIGGRDIGFRLAGGFYDRKTT